MRRSEEGRGGAEACLLEEEVEASSSSTPEHALTSRTRCLLPFPPLTLSTSLSTCLFSPFVVGCHTQHAGNVLSCEWAQPVATRRRGDYRTWHAEGRGGAGLGERRGGRGG